MPILYYYLNSKLNIGVVKMWTHFALCSSTYVVHMPFT